MDKIVYITPTFAVSAALEPADYAQLHELGFKTIVSNLPDGEDQAKLTGRESAAQAWQNGLAFRHIPAGKLDLFTDDVVDAMEDTLRRAEGPILAHCISGMRSAIIWAAATARNQPVDCVLAALERAGFELDFLRDELDEQANRKRWIGSAAAMDCEETAPTSLPADGAAAA